MGPKSAKKPQWVICDKCNSNLTYNTIETHIQQDCDVELNAFKIPHIRNKVLYSFLEFIDNNKVGDPYKPNPEDVLYVSCAAASICNLTIGENILIRKCDRSVSPIVRKFWPSKSPSSTSVLIVGDSVDTTWANDNNRKVAVSKFNSQIYLASKIEIITSKATTEMVSELCKILPVHMKNKIINKNNKLKYNYFGNELDLIITNIFTEDTMHKDEEIIWFKLDITTKWDIKTGIDNERKEKITVNLGGVDDIIGEITSLMDLALSNNTVSHLCFVKGVMLHGISGTGKTAICNHILGLYDCHKVRIEGSAIFSKYFGETENTIKRLFKEAVQNAPSIILVDEIDTVCPKKVSGATDQEKRVTSTFSLILDSLHNGNTKVFLLANTSKPDMIDPALRRYGRLDREIEVPIPDKERRRKILSKILEPVHHNLQIDEINSISDTAHGYVGADLMNLCTEANMQALKNETQNQILNYDNFSWALSMTKPSAMREVLIEVPNVKLSDIGGQEELKLKLKQAVEWPLTHAESFAKFGIKPPNGVLMYGPPGCSKTMIAKALANESGLNFLSIKGPELFSKWVGESERAVRELFRKARQVSPSIIFFDEIDALGGERMQGNGSANVNERVLAQILTELDGIVPLNNVTIVAATNRPDKIDRALLRPGRIDRLVYVPLPDYDTRKAILRLKLSKMPVTEDLSLDDLCCKTEGYSGAEVQAVCHEAALRALEEDLDVSEVCCKHFEYALGVVKPRTPKYLLDCYEKFTNNNRT